MTNETSDKIGIGVGVVIFIVIVVLAVMASGSHGEKYYELKRCMDLRNQ